MDLPLETLVLIAVVTIAAVVGLLELRYLRGRRQAKVDAAIERDDAYNAVSTTRAVADSLRQNGRDTTEADVLIYKAETAYDRREFLNATELAGKAKKVLLTCKEKDLISMPSPAPAKEESTEVPSNLIKKMPANCLESRFMIDSVRGMASGADEKAKAEADSCLARAQACYEAEDYNGALSEAMKARRLLTPCPLAGEKSYPSAVVRLPPPEKTPANAASSPGPRLCPGCRVEASPDDAFCRKCGTRLEG